MSAYKKVHREIAKLVRQYHSEYGREACLSSIVRAWLLINGVSRYTVGHSQYIQQAVELVPADDLEVRISRLTGEFSLKQAEVALESLIDADQKRAEGAVYTPDYIIDYIVRQCTEMRSEATCPRLVDPACGSGGFLVRAIPILSEKYNISKEKVINEFTYGIDVNRDAIEYAKLAIELFCAKTSTGFPPDFDFLVQDDTLLADKKTLLHSLDIAKDGFDIIVTNPPYVKLQNLSDNYRSLLIEAYPGFAKGSFSLAMLFLIAGFRLLSQTGVLGYITQNNIYTSLAGESVRDFLQSHKSIHTIVDFGHKKIFPDASAYTCLLFLDKTPQETFRFNKCNEPEVQLPTLHSSDFHDIEIGSLKKDKWRLAPANHLRNLRQLESNGTPLGKLADIRVGFATLKDSVFVIDDPRNHSGIEQGITTPAIRIADFSKEFQLRDNRTRVIQPYRKVSGKWTLLKEEDLLQEYPKAYAHLKLHQTELAKRDKGRKVAYKFYEWGRSQCMEAPGPKLLTKTFNRGPNFLLDDTDSLFCNGYSVKPAEGEDMFSSPIDIRVLQKVLNSWVMNYYARLTSFQIEGDYQCFQKNFIERFCIPSISPDSADTIAALDGTDLQEYLCELFAIPVTDILQVVPDRATSNKSP